MADMVKLLCAPICESLSFLQLDPPQGAVSWGPVAIEFGRFRTEPGLVQQV